MPLPGVLGVKIFGSRVIGARSMLSGTRIRQNSYPRPRESRPASLKRPKRSERHLSLALCNTGVDVAAEFRTMFKGVLGIKHGSDINVNTKAI